MKTNSPSVRRESSQFDPHWQDSFGCLNQFVRREGHARVDVYHREEGFRLGQWVKIQRGQRSELNPKQRDALSRLPGWVWDDSPRTTWQDHLVEMEKYGHTYGHTQVPLSYCAEGLRLGFWVAEQRLRYTQGELSCDRIDALEQVSCWTWSSSPAKLAGVRNVVAGPLTWERGYDLLRRFVAREGHARVPASHVEDSVKLGQWVRDQRARRLRLQPTKCLSLERLPGWTWQAWADRWQQGFQHLMRYVERENTAYVPVAHVEDSYKLGVWVRAQRMRKSKLSPEQLRVLEALPGWTWRAGKSNEEWWSMGFDSLRQFTQEHGHCDVPFAARVEGFCLGRWVRLQRLKHKSGELPAEKARLLTGLPGWMAEKRRQPRP